MKCQAILGSLARKQVYIRIEHRINASGKGVGRRTGQILWHVEHPVFWAVLYFEHPIFPGSGAVVFNRASGYGIISSGDKIRTSLGREVVPSFRSLRGSMAKIIFRRVRRIKAAAPLKAICTPGRVQHSNPDVWGADDNSMRRKVDACC